MASIWAADRAQRFYVGIALFSLAAVVVGFSTTYLIPMARRTFAAPPIVHLHGVAALAWLCLLLAQALLVRNGRTKLHMRIGRRGYLWPSSFRLAESLPPPGGAKLLRGMAATCATDEARLALLDVAEDLDAEVERLGSEDVTSAPARLCDPLFHWTTD